MSRVAKVEVEEKLKALSERDAVVNALEDERSDRKAVEEQIKKEAYDLAKAEAFNEILDYRMSFRRLALFMIREKYPNVDLT